MLLVSFVHQVIADLFSDSRIKDFLLYLCMYLELNEGLRDDLLLLGSRMRPFETVKKILHSVMILDQDGNGVVFRQQQLFKHPRSPSNDSFAGSTARQRLSFNLWPEGCMPRRTAAELLSGRFYKRRPK